MSEPGISADLVTRAERIARAAHAGQFRRDGCTPYIDHPRDVARRVGDDPLAQAAAWLHDVLEDTTETPDSLREQGMPALVIDAVVRLTRRDDLPDDVYYAAIRADPIARQVKTADMITNLADKPTDRQILKYAKGLLALHG